MKKWFSLFFVLLVIATGCQTYRGDGAAAGAGTYPLKTSPASDDTVLITVVDSSKAGGFDIRRTPMANIPVSTPVQTALNLKQDASTAVTADDVQDAIDEAIAGVDGSTITADTTDPTKAASAVAADSATYATTAGTAGTVAAVSGDSVTSGTVADARIAPTIARDSEVAASISSAVAGKFDTPTGTTSQVVLGDGTLGSLPAGSTITADTTDNTKAAAAVSADSASALTPSKVLGVPSVNFFHEANGTDTNGNGFIGPLNATKNYLLRADLENGTVAVDQVLKVGSIATDQTVPMGSGSMVADIVTLILADESGGGASVEDDAYSSSWDGDTAAAASKNALYDKISSLETQITTMISAFSAAGLNAFTFTPGSTFPLWIDGDGATLSVDVTDTSASYVVDSVAYQANGAGGFVNSLTNTTGDTWTALFDPDTDGTYTVQYRATDNKSTENTGDSATYTIYRDATAPSVNAGTDTTHDGAGTAVTLSPTITDANLVSKWYRTTSEDGATVVTDWTQFTDATVDVTLPSTTSNYRIYARGTDHLQSTDDYLVASYSAPIAAPQDTFTDSDLTALASHTSDSNHTWTQNGGGTVIVHTNHAESSQSTSAGLYYSSFVPADADYTVKADTSSSGSGVPIFIAGRCSTSAVTMYGVRWNGTGTWELTRWVSGTRTVIGTYVGDSPVGSTRTIELIMTGTTIAVDIGGTQRISVTDSGITAAGRPGIGTWYNDVATYHNLILDNYEVTD